MGIAKAAIAVMALLASTNVAASPTAPGSSDDNSVQLSYAEDSATTGTNDPSNFSFIEEKQPDLTATDLVKGVSSVSEELNDELNSLTDDAVNLSSPDYSLHPNGKKIHSDQEAVWHGVFIPCAKALCHDGKRKTGATCLDYCAHKANRVLTPETLTERKKGCDNAKKCLENKRKLEKTLGGGMVKCDMHSYGCYGFDLEKTSSSSTSLGITANNTLPSEDLHPRALGEYKTDFMEFQDLWIFAYQVCMDKSCTKAINETCTRTCVSQADRMLLPEQQAERKDVCEGLKSCRKAGKEAEGTGTVIDCFPIGYGCFDIDTLTKSPTPPPSSAPTEQSSSRLSRRQAPQAPPFWDKIFDQCFEVAKCQDNRYSKALQRIKTPICKHYPACDEMAVRWFDRRCALAPECIKRGQYLQAKWGVDFACPLQPWCSPPPDRKDEEGCACLKFKRQLREEENLWGDLDCNIDPDCPQQHSEAGMTGQALAPVHGKRDSSERTEEEVVPEKRHLTKEECGKVVELCEDDTLSPSLEFLDQHWLNPSMPTQVFPRCKIPAECKE